MIAGIEHDGAATLSEQATRITLSCRNEAIMPEPPNNKPTSPRNGTPDADVPTADAPAEIGGRGGLDPIRYGDWEKNGRCIDF